MCETLGRSRLCLQQPQIRLAAPQSEMHSATDRRDNPHVSLLSPLSVSTVPSLLPGRSADRNLFVFAGIDVSFATSRRSKDGGPVLLDRV
jgi:hypothetical protein